MSFKKNYFFARAKIFLARAKLLLEQKNFFFCSSKRFMTTFYLQRGMDDNSYTNRKPWSS
jgi:hypothetical protein